MIRTRDEWLVIAALTAWTAVVETLYADYRQRWMLGVESSG